MSLIGVVCIGGIELTLWILTSDEPAEPAALTKHARYPISNASLSKVNEVDSNLRSYSMNPSLGSVASLCVLTNSKASSNFIENRRIMNMMTEVAERDMPIAQCTRHFVLKSGLSWLTWRNSFYMRTYSFY